MSDSTHLPRRREPSRLKTYSHLARERRMPTDYEIVTTALLYNKDSHFEVTTPLGDWYQEHQERSLLQASAWDAFVDPRETTYAKYIMLARDREVYLDGVFQSMDESRYDASLTVDWRRRLARVLDPLRYPLHGLQMISAYVGQMAPSGRITVAAAFQTADELRRIQRVAYRMTQLVEPGRAPVGREVWQRDQAWQPLREAVERCLVAYDWGQALVALNVCLKPVIDEIFMVHLASLAKQNGDYLLGQIFASLYQDCQWHRGWTVTLLRMAVQDRGKNRSVIAEWAAKWSELALGAAKALETVVPQRENSSVVEVVADLRRQIGDEAPQ